VQEARAAVELQQQEQHERAMAAMEALLEGGRNFDYCKEGVMCAVVCALSGV